MSHNTRLTLTVMRTAEVSVQLQERFNDSNISNLDFTLYSANHLLLPLHASSEFCKNNGSSYLYMPLVTFSYVGMFKR